MVSSEARAIGVGTLTALFAAPALPARALSAPPEPQSTSEWMCCSAHAWRTPLHAQRAHALSARGASRTSYQATPAIPVLRALLLPTSTGTHTLHVLPQCGTAQAMHASTATTLLRASSSLSTS
jgi:hypothetical protein